MSKTTVEPMYGQTYLPRKFKVGVAYPEDNCIDIYTQDLGLIARVDGEQLIGFTVVIGGGMGSTHGKVGRIPCWPNPSPISASSRLYRLPKPLLLSSETMEIAPIVSMRV